MDILYVLLQAFAKINKQISDNQKNVIQNSTFDEMHNLHFTLGMWIRNNILSENNEIFHVLKKYGISDEDSMSMFVIQMYYLHLHSAFNDIL